MADEIRIVAKLDTTDITNGVQRTERAAREMKQVWEQSTAVGFPVDQIGDKLKDGVPWGQLGQNAGKSFFDGFLGKLLLRDAIYGLISGVMQSFKTLTGDLANASGDNGPQPGVWAQAGHVLSNWTENIFTPIRDSSVAGVGNEMSREAAARNMDRVLTAARENPKGVGKTSVLEDQLSEIQDQRDANRKDYENHRLGAAMTGNLNSDEAGRLKANFEPQERYLAAMEQGLKELVSIGRERDKKEGKSSAAAHDKTRRDEETALEHSRSEERTEVANAAKAAAKRAAADEKAAKAAEKKAAADEKRAAALAARISKNHQQHANAQTIAGDEAAERSGDKELSFDRGQLEHQRATSAVRINGGLYGRNDSAATLVQHAAAQVQLLRMIAEELKQTRKNQSDLTLL